MRIARAGPCRAVQNFYPNFARKASSFRAGMDSAELSVTAQAFNAVRYWLYSGEGHYPS
jgi:hypothetical protein